MMCDALQVKLYAAKPQTMPCGVLHEPRLAVVLVRTCTASRS